MPSKAQFLELFPRASAAHLNSLAENADEVLGRFGFNENKRRLEFLLAQIGHESGGLTIVVENLSYTAQRIVQVWPGRFPTVRKAEPYARNPERLANFVYANRMGNGPPESGDGFRYRGRGYIQITGRDGYQQVGAIAGLDLVGKPDLAADPRHALVVACAFWKWKRINELCDAGDFLAVTRRINGGTVGIDDRLAWLDKVRRVFAKPAPAASQPAADVVIAVQKALQANGYREVGAADGEVGKRTLAAITRFRSENGMPPGVIDAALLRALGVDAGAPVAARARKPAGSPASKSASKSASKLARAKAPGTRASSPRKKATTRARTKRVRIDR